MIPDLWGYAPLACRADPRWGKVKDARAGVVVAPTGEAISRYVSERVIYRPEAQDRWSPPRETLRRGYGDCEDMAILKRSLWIGAGLPETECFVALVYDRIARQDHAVFIAREAGKWRVFDSGTTAVLDLEAVPDYTPQFAFQSVGTWVFGRRG